jgi:AraC-like DNA-binding protein
MIETPYELFLRSPVGRFTLTSSSLVWCSSASLCGAFFWGRPDVDTTLDQAATQLGVSARSLQRILTRQGTTFHDEVVAARLALAKKILLTSDQKLAGVGARVGISERALTLLFRAQTGLTPAEWRKQQRG